MAETKSVSIRIPKSDLALLNELDDGPLAAKIKKAIRTYLRLELEEGFKTFESFETETFITPSQIATKLNVSVQTVTKWCRKGKIRAIKLGGRWIVPVSEIPQVLKPNVCEIQNIKNSETNR